MVILYKEILKDKTLVNSRLDILDDDSDLGVSKSFQKA